MIVSKNTAKGVILQNNQVLLIKKEYADGRVIYTLPGGTQELGEPLEKTVVREVWEEVGAKVQPVQLAKVYEHQRASKSRADVIKYKIEFAFVCELIGSYEPHLGEQPDPSQTGVEWLALSDLGNYSLDPANLSNVLQAIANSQGPVYHNLIK